MPPKSQQQAKFMRAVAAGTAKAPGLSKAEAKEFVSGHATKGLPARVSHPKGGGGKKGH